VNTSLECVHQPRKPYLQGLTLAPIPGANPVCQLRDDHGARVAAILLRFEPGDHSRIAVSLRRLADDIGIQKPTHSLRRRAGARRRGGKSSGLTGQALSTVSQFSLPAKRRNTRASSSASKVRVEIVAGRGGRGGRKTRGNGQPPLGVERHDHSGIIPPLIIRFKIVARVKPAKKRRSVCRRSSSAMSDFSIARWRPGADGSHRGYSVYGILLACRGMLSSPMNFEIGGAPYLKSSRTMWHTPCGTHRIWPSARFPAQLESQQFPLSTNARAADSERREAISDVVRI